MISTSHNVVAACITAYSLIITSIDSPKKIMKDLDLSVISVVGFSIRRIKKLGLLYGTKAKYNTKS